MAEDLKVIADTAKLIPIKWLPTFGAVNLVLMALLPIVVGTYRSLQVVKKSNDKVAVINKLKCNCKVCDNKLIIQCDEFQGSHRPEVLTPKSAAMFPVYGSCALVGVYVFTKV